MALIVLLLVKMALAADEQADERLQEALLSVDSAVKKLEQFKDSRLSARSIADTAGIVCRYAKPHAAALFERALAPLSEVEGSEDVTSAYSFVIAMATRCDSALGARLGDAARELLDGADPSAINRHDIGLARAALSTDPEQAAALAKLAASKYSETDRSAAMYLVGFLQNLRLTNPTAADAMFELAMQSLPSMTNPFSHLSALGGYVFASPARPGFAAAAPDSWTVGFVGGQGVFSYGELRSSLPAGLAVIFLRQALAVLAAPRSDPNLLEIRFALGVQYRTLSQAFAPDLVPNYQGLLGELAAAIPDERIRERAEERYGSRNNEDTDSKDLDEQSVEERERRKLGSFADSVRAADFERAREIGSELEGIESRQQASQLVEFFEGAARVKSDEFESAARNADALPTGVKRGLLYLAMAHAVENDAVEAGKYLRFAIDDAERVEMKFQPYLLLAAAESIVPIDIDWALTTLQQAVDGFNEIDYKKRVENKPEEQTRTGGVRHGERVFEPYEIRVSSSGFREYFDNGYTSRSFRLAVPEVTGFRFSNALSAFKQAEPERLESILVNLQGESHLAEALAFAVEARLFQATQPAQVDRTSAPEPER